VTAAASSAWMVVVVVVEAAVTAVPVRGRPGRRGWATRVGLLFAGGECVGDIEEPLRLLRAL
jgi:hypothetical protein